MYLYLPNDEIRLNTKFQFYMKNNDEHGFRNNILFTLIFSISMNLHYTNYKYKNNLLKVKNIWDWFSVKLNLKLKEWGETEINPTFFTS